MNKSKIIKELKKEIERAKKEKGYITINSKWSPIDIDYTLVNLGWIPSYKNDWIQKLNSYIGYQKNNEHLIFSFNGFSRCNKLLYNNTGVMFVEE